MKKNTIFAMIFKLFVCLLVGDSGWFFDFFREALMFDVENWNFTLVSYNYSIPGSTFQNCCKLLITVTAP